MMLLVYASLEFPYLIKLFLHRLSGFGEYFTHIVMNRLLNILAQFYNQFGVPPTFFNIFPE